jgi:DNA-binding response OmpR family regulator
MEGQIMADNILIIEDDREIAGVVARNLESSGWKTEQAHDGLTGLEKALTGSFQAVILDIMLPGMDGISLCRRFRETDGDTPILMLTAKTDEIDLVLSLELGADDYLTKPFSMRELIARVKALLRRSRRNGSDRPSESPPEEKILQSGELKLDLAGHRAWLRGMPLNLTVKEFELLCLFAANPGRAYSRSDLLNIVWGYNFEGYEHTVNTHINRLRNKIERDASHPEYLETVWGIGYRFHGEKGEVV